MTKIIRGSRDEQFYKFVCPDCGKYIEAVYKPQGGVCSTCRDKRLSKIPVRRDG